MVSIDKFSAPRSIAQKNRIVPLLGFKPQPIRGAAKGSFISTFWSGPTCSSVKKIGLS